MSPVADDNGIPKVAAGFTLGTGQLYPMSIVWIIVAFIVVGLRVLTRVYVVKNPAADDALIVAALFASLAMSVTMIEQVNAGMNTTHPDTVRVNKSFWASVWTYNLSLTLTKVSILVSYFRIFIQKPLRRLCWILLGFMVTFGLWTIIGSILVCVPVEKSWTTMDLYGSEYCMNRYNAWFANAAVNMVIDLTLIILPMPILKGLNMPMKQKIALMLVFALGTFVCVMSAIRLYFLVSMSEDNDNRKPATWSVIETNVGIICASLPSLKAGISWLWPRFAGSSFSSKSNNNAKTPSEFAADDTARAFAVFSGLKPAGQHSTRVQGNYESRPQKGFTSRKDFMLKSLAGSQSATLSGSPPDKTSLDEPGIAVTTILEQEIETMAEDGGSSGRSSPTQSIPDESSQKDLFRSDSGNEFHYAK